MLSNRLPLHTSHPLPFCITCHCFRAQSCKVWGFVSSTGCLRQLLSNVFFSRPHNISDIPISNTTAATLWRLVSCATEQLQTGNLKTSLVVTNFCTALTKHKSQACFLSCKWLRSLFKRHTKK